MIADQPVECPEALMRRARGHGAAKAVIVGADRPGVMESVRDAVGEGLIEPVLAGDPETICRLASENGLALDGIEILPASGDRELAQACAVRAATGDIALVVKGHVHTDALMAALLRPEAAIRQQGKRLTHCFHMSVPGCDRPLIITDAAVNVAPNLETKQAAIANAVALAGALGISRAKVAVLSATETPLPQIPSSMEAAELTEWAGRASLDADVFGPLAFDIAVSPDAARIKGIDNPVAGNADILLAPCIETGNALFKAMVYLRAACAAGVVLGGRLPVALTSRADPPAARLASIALARISAGA